MNAANHHLRRALALALAIAAALAIPATAQAAFAKVDSAGKLTFTAVSGEANNLAVTYSASTAHLAETGHLGPFPVLIAGSGGCSGVAAQITCSGAGPATINSGDGDDRIAARNGVAEHISCGPGSDSVVADASDVVGADCETVDRPAAGTAGPAPTVQHSAPGTPGTTTATNPPAGSGDAADDTASPFVNIVPPVIPNQTATVSTSGVVRVQVECPTEAGSCHGTIALVLAGQPGHARLVAAAAKAVHGIKLGGATFTARAGEKPIVRIRLNRRGRQRILRARHTRCRIVVTTRGADGNVVTTSRDISLRPTPPPKKSKGGRHR
jgi:hypothetical protein